MNNDEKNGQMQSEILWLTSIDESFRGIKIGPFIDTLQASIANKRAIVFYRNGTAFAWLLWGFEPSFSWVAWGAPHGVDDQLIDSIKESLSLKNESLKSSAGPWIDQTMISHGPPVLHFSLEDLLRDMNLNSRPIQSPQEYFSNFWHLTYSVEMEGYLKKVLHLLPHSKAHRKYYFGFLLSRLLPPFLCQQYRIYENLDGPYAYLNWAQLSQANSKRYFGGDYTLHFEDWQSGSTVWMMEIITKNGLTTQIMQDCKRHFLPHTEIHYFLVDQNDAERYHYNYITLPETSIARN